MKLITLTIEDFRRFDIFNLKQLGRVNLLVGTNNCGKTTVLEGICILAAIGDPSAIWSTLTRRGEEFYRERNHGTMRQVDIRCLYKGHELNVGKSFKISADTDLGRLAMSATIEEVQPKQGQLFDTERQLFESTDDFLQPMSLVVDWANLPDKSIQIPISSRGGITLDGIRLSGKSTSSEIVPIRFITASSLTADIVTSLFEEIVLTPAEELVTDAMRIIEPAIDRIASSGGERYRSPNWPYSRGGMLIRLKGIKDRVPIGSMGDGIWRMLGLALSVVRSSNGILLVDEIDTGLHHTVLKEMWSFVHKCAKLYNVQVIATTHSWDCYHALAVICRETVSEDSEVTISRIERGRNTAIAYTEQEIIAAANRDIEVR